MTFKQHVLFFPLLKVITPVPSGSLQWTTYLVSYFVLTSSQPLVDRILGTSSRLEMRVNSYWKICALMASRSHRALVPGPCCLAISAWAACAHPLSRQTCWAGVRLITTWHIFCLHHTPPTQQESAESSRRDQATAFGLLNLTVERCATHARSCPLLSRRHYRENS